MSEELRPLMNEALELAHAKRGTDLRRLLRESDPLRVYELAEVMTHALSITVDKRVEHELLIEDSLLEEVADAWAENWELRDALVRYRRPWWLRWWWR